MRHLSGSETRETFLRFFESKGHRRVHSSSLVPANDPTLLFTNAGMNQFKDVFLGIEKRDYSRATTSQKCVRAGGKHNDLENVGFTRRHHTFFEMLGNFSFGDYFKKDAIAYAWELVTSEQWYGLPKDRLYVTIFDDPDKAAASRELGFDVERDSEAERYWLETGVPKDRIFPGDRKDNFWQMGDTGPCGPCSEIHYDMGPEASDEGHTDCKFPCDCGRYVEIWNLVFMQYDRTVGGTTKLPRPSIDTGMGLERVAAVLQGALSNYDTDLFTPLIKRAGELTQSTYGFNPNADASLRIIADHARATTLLISDGVMPSNEGRGYVLRKILRRGIRHGRLLGTEKPFMWEMVFAVRDQLKDAYPELVDSALRVSRIVLTEEHRFAHTLAIGLKGLEGLIAEAKAAPAETTREHVAQLEQGASELKGLIHEAGPPEATEYGIYRGILKGEDAFKLFDTFGLPLDFMLDASRDHGVYFDRNGFDRAMQEQRERARASWKGGAKQTASPIYRDLGKTVFEGYKQTVSGDCEVLAIVKDGQGVPELKAGEEGEVVLDHTPFYADSGGQVGDIGVFRDSSGNVIAEVNGCVMPVQGVRAHKVKARQPIHLGQKLEALVHADVREATKRNHTGTHLLHAALRETLGKHVKQAGSLVAPGHLRFDFSHFTSVADEELQDIEDLMNREVLKNTRVETFEDVPIDVAINEFKAMALFGEKYGERVRVVKIGDFSTELCGGIHTLATGEIGLLKILREGSVSSGVRRVEAVSGEGSLQHFRKDHELQHVVSTLIGRADDSPAQALKTELERRDEEIRRLRKELEQIRMKSASSAVSAAADQVQEANGIKVLTQRVDNLERNQMRTLVDNMRNKLGSGVVVLGSVQDGKVALIVGVTKDLTTRVQAGKIIAEVAKKVGGKGGGRPDLAEAGGSEPGALDSALRSSVDVVRALAS
ncbi:MAG TPA: alanine--tRNA ligase [Terriglobales bacterium]|jgi:alanyl-tRNA synthetase|nr:alanine--tRNA ligase [Terriglobales bacterium]